MAVDIGIGSIVLTDTQKDTIKRYIPNITTLIGYDLNYNQKI